MHDTITGPVFQEMLIFGAASIAKEKQSINDLNVFPVPDGDTGTNMSLTMHAAAQELQKRSPATVDLASSITASALLRGARGNSGVILSLLFRGLSKALKGMETADAAAFAAEVIGVPDFSIGANLYEAKIYLDTASLFAWTLAIILIASCFEKILLRLMTAAGGKGNTVHEKQ